MDDLRDDLDAYAGEVDYPPNDWDGEPSPLRDADHANRLLRSYAHLAREAAEINAVAAAEIERIKAWQADRLAGNAARAEWLTTQLEGWARASGQKTYNLPNGTLRLRAPRARLVVTDEPAFVAWAASEHPDLLRVKTEPNRTALLKLPAGPDDTIIDRTSGETIPGVALDVDEQDSFSVTAAQADQ